ncbi:hemerythrin domain-containing protein [Methanomassiliicoccus luminyensis]|jgi:hypothetical protein|uniref:hypothetical protein n=1 Tax=Methanomassiliicoccus luminyensis TaxID=1080712 RepID=UPI00035DCABD|nr:hypothetical protein [Methanomassiliicoccus luminyensis]
MELFDKIKAEHKEFNDQMTGLVGSDPVSRREKVIALNTFVLAHQKAEEETIYEAFKELDGVPRSMALVRCEEHHVHELLTTELEDEELADDIWVAKLKVLMFMYQHHASYEEKELYDMAVDYFTDDEIREFLKKYEEVEGRLFAAVRYPPPSSEVLSRGQ